MGTKSWKTVAAGLATFALAASPAAAVQPLDYGKNGATGQYAPQVHLVKNYGLNGASGDYAPQVPSQAPSVVPAAPTTTSSSSFAWGAALAGAGVTLLLTLTLGGTLRIRRRTSRAPRVA